MRFNKIIKTSTRAQRSVLWLIMFGTMFFKFNAVNAQTDSVDVTFYYKSVANLSAVYLPGEFNNWGNNQSGRISDPRFAMTFDAENSRWAKTIRLRVGGPQPLPNPGKSIPGAYQYKFNENGSANGWINDPLNPRVNLLDYNNSYLFINNPTIHYLLPNSVSGLVSTSLPLISAYIYPSLSSSVDTASIVVLLDGIEYRGVGSGYDPETKLFQFSLLRPLSNGTHTIQLFAQSSTGSFATDSTSFIVQAGFVQLLTRSNPRYLRAVHTIEGIVSDAKISQAELFHNGDSTAITVSEGYFSQQVNLFEGDNIFQVSVKDSQGILKNSSPITITYWLNHSPEPQISIVKDEEIIVFSAIGNDPDGDSLNFSWQSDDLDNPEPLGISTQGTTVSVPIPETAGEYYVELSAIDHDGNKGFARSYFMVDSNKDIKSATTNSNPQWVKDAVVYEIYLPAFSAQGTITAALDRLQWIKSLGANVIWFMPIYENGEMINEVNAGYNITDFYKIHPQLGSMEDFDVFIQEAHSMGLKVILDSTPNHVSAYHPWIDDIKLFKNYSNYRSLIETRILGDNRGMGQYLKTSSGYPIYVHYDGWGLANLNYSNIETVDYMMNMYKWWLREKDIDGYRMDVYWGPQNRYGKSAWWRPFREQIKRLRADVFILGETSGTGPGSENNYADNGGASDACYDWNFYGQIKATLSNGSISELDKRVRNYSPNLNYNYYTGSNAHYFRFLENHDEERIIHNFSVDKTKAAASLLMTIPGIPMIYAGQEVGETNRRGKINWERTDGQSLFKYYQRLIHIRKNYLTFSTPKIKQISNNQARIYSYLRPYIDQNGIVAVNYSASSVQTTLNIDPDDLAVSSDSLLTGKVYYLNDVLNDTSYTVTKNMINNFQLELPSWGSAVFVLSDTLIRFVTEVTKPVIMNSPKTFKLSQNYPNPFNSMTAIRYSLNGKGSLRVTLRVYNILGEEIRVLVDETQNMGSYNINWDGKDKTGENVAAGMYFYQLKVGTFVQCRKMAIMR